MIEDSELLKATIAVAVADGKLQRSEMGVIQGLADRVGIGEASYQAMVEAARTDESFVDNLFIPKENAHQAIVLLVGEARIDGEISTEEREVITRIGISLGVSGDEFHAAYREGIKRADAIRASRGP